MPHFTKWFSIVYRVTGGDTAREISLSSTDTASSSGSTPQSCPQSVEKIKPELLDAVENGKYFRSNLSG
jgi:hypothetical protein